MATSAPAGLDYLGMVKIGLTDIDQAASRGREPARGIVQNRLGTSSTSLRVPEWYRRRAHQDQMEEDMALKKAKPQEALKKPKVKEPEPHQPAENIDSETRRLLRTAAWSRMFGRADGSKNPFSR